MLMGYNPIMLRRCLVICAVTFAPNLMVFAQDEHLPADTVSAHFQEILAEDYVAADQYFSGAFRRAFKAERRSQVDQYYLARREQLASGYQLVDTWVLADSDRDTAVVIVEFNDPRPDAFLSVSERIYYYLVLEKVEAGSPQVHSDGRAWRIEIFDALLYDSLADARRRPYLYTSEAWPEDESFQLKSLQGLFRIQDALERFHQDHGQYPFRLLGSDNRRDELLSGGYLYGRYPDNGYSDRSMRAREFGLKSSGDFAYYSVDADNDGWREGYWLLLHGKADTEFIFRGYDTVHILSNLDAGTQSELALLFSQFWAGRAGQSLELSPAWLAANEVAPNALTPELAVVLPPPSATETAVIGQPVDAAQLLEPLEVVPEEIVPAVPSIRELTAAAHGRVLGQQIQLQLQALGQVLLAGMIRSDEAQQDDFKADVNPDLLQVYSFGW